MWNLKNKQKTNKNKLTDTNKLGLPEGKGLGAWVKQLKGVVMATRLVMVITC